MENQRLFGLDYHLEKSGTGATDVDFGLVVSKPRWHEEMNKERKKQRFQTNTEKTWAGGGGVPGAELSHGLCRFNTLWATARHKHVHTESK